MIEQRQFSIGMDLGEHFEKGIKYCHCTEGDSGRTDWMCVLNVE